MMVHQSQFGRANRVKVKQGKPYAGNPHVRFDEGEVASCTVEALLRRVPCRRQPEGCASRGAAKPRRGSLFYKSQKKAASAKPFDGRVERVARVVSIVFVSVASTVLSAQKIDMKKFATSSEAFPVMCWEFRRFESIDDIDRKISDWVELGINHPISPCVGARTDKRRFLAFLDKCHEAGLRVYVMDERVCMMPGIHSDYGDSVLFGKGEAEYRRMCREVKDDWAGHPAVEGFYIYDEPTKGPAETLYARIRAFKEEVPGKVPYLNLLPWFEGEFNRLVLAGPHWSAIQQLPACAC